MTAVLDASIALTWLLADQDAVSLRLRSVECIVPEIFITEVVNVLVRAERQRRGRDAVSIRQLSEVHALRVRVESTTSSQLFLSVVPLARLHRISVFDATYLELALRRSLLLATTDAGLRRAATAASVPLI